MVFVGTNKDVERVHNLKKDEGGRVLKYFLKIIGRKQQKEG